MCLRYWNIVGDGSEAQLEDQVYRRHERNGWSRHDPFGIKQCLQSYPDVFDDLTTAGSLADIREAIDFGLPCIIHGYFTRFGHIVVVIGYDEKGLIIHDPYGEYHATGYDTYASGASLHYSYDLICRTCSPESIQDPCHIWLHRVGRGADLKKKWQARK